MLCSAPSVPQPVFTITERKGPYYLNVKAVVAAFNQEKALVGAFSVIVQLHSKHCVRSAEHQVVGAGVEGEF